MAYQVANIQAFVAQGDKMARLSDFHPDNLGPERPTPEEAASRSVDRLRDMFTEDPAGAYGEGYSENVQQEASDLRQQMQRAVQEAASEHIGQPLNNETRNQLSATVANAVISSINNTSDRVDRVMGTSTDPLMGGVLNNGTSTLTNRTLSVPVHNIELEMFITNMNGVVKDEHGNPLVCYGCAGSAADVSYPSYAVEWRCLDCTRCFDEDMRSKGKGDKTDKYITYEYSEEFTTHIKALYKEKLKKEVIEELNTNKTILTGQKLKRLIKNG